MPKPIGTEREEFVEELIEADLSTDFEIDYWKLADFILAREQAAREAALIEAGWERCDECELLHPSHKMRGLFSGDGQVVGSVCDDCVLKAVHPPANQTKEKV